MCRLLQPRLQKEKKQWFVKNAFFKGSCNIINLGRIRKRNIIVNTFHVIPHESASDHLFNNQLISILLHYNKSWPYNENQLVIRIIIYPSSALNHYHFLCVVKNNPFSLCFQLAHHPALNLHLISNSIPLPEGIATEFVIDSRATVLVTLFSFFLFCSSTSSSFN